MAFDRFFIMASLAHVLWIDSTPAIDLGHFVIMMILGCLACDQFPDVKGVVILHCSLHQSCEQCWNCTAARCIRSSAKRITFQPYQDGPPTLEIERRRAETKFGIVESKPLFSECVYLGQIDCSK